MNAKVRPSQLKHPPRAAAAELALVMQDPMEDELNRLVDDMCKITVGISSAFRYLKAGNRSAVVKQMRTALRLLGDSNARAGIILWETSKSLEQPARRQALLGPGRKTLLSR